MARALVLVFILGCVGDNEPEPELCGPEPSLPTWSFEEDLEAGTIILLKDDYITLRNYVVWARCTTRLGEYK